MKIATYNFCQGGSDYDALYQVLTRLHPDILLAQELLDPQEYAKRSQMSWRTLGYRDPIWLPVPGNTKHWGSAIFTKWDVGGVIAIPESLQGWVVGVECDLSHIFEHQHGPLKIFSVHTPTRSPNDYVRQAQEVLEFIGEHQTDASILIGGDFNVTIGAGRKGDEIQTTNDENEIIAYIHRSLGLINCWQTANLQSPLPTTFHAQSSRAHLDGIFISARWFRYLAACHVANTNPNWPTRGDHYPVVAEFDASRPSFDRTARAGRRAAEAQSRFVMREADIHRL